MTDTAALVIQTGLPTVAVLTGILISLVQSNRLDGRIDKLEATVRAELAVFRAELAVLRTELNSFKDLMHRDIMSLITKTGETETRLAVAEEKLKE